MKEAAIQRQIIKWLESNGAFVVKTVTTNKSGVPDLLVCWFGRFIAIEVKRPTGKVTKLQEYKIGQINSAGGVAFVAYGAQDAIDKLLAYHPKGDE